MALSLSIENLSKALVAWRFPAPITVSELGLGFQGETWLITAGDRRYVAKLCYDTQASFEIGLKMAEIVERHGISSGAPLRTIMGELSVLVAHPPGQQHPLALLRYVPGSPLDLTAPDAPRLVGTLLGRIHRLLRDDADIVGLDDAVLPYVTEDQPAVFVRYPWLRPLLLRAVAGVRTFEDTTPVTYGGIFGDVLEVIYDEQPDRVGVVDWGAAGKGPLLFDLALVIDQFRRAGSDAIEVLIDNYAAAAAVTTAELGGLDRYSALLWARQAKSFAWRLVNHVTRGDPDFAAREQTLATYRRKLEEQLERYEAEGGR